MYYELRTPRLLLRPMGTGDLSSVHEYASDAENTRFMVYLPNDTIEETVAFLKRTEAEWQKSMPRVYEFAVVLGGRQIGAVSVSLNNSRDIGELGWIINKRYWKMGYAYEAAQAVYDFAVRELKVEKLIAFCDARNLSSRGLMEKLGLRLESGDGERIYVKSGERARELTYSKTVRA